MDFDGDDILDLVSGSYAPGELYLFRGTGKGQFKARETIVDKSGKPIIRKPNQEDPIESFGSWLALVDWDDDADLDIILGGFDGSMYLRLNEGTRTKPAYATENIRIQAGGKDLAVPGHHATPVVADWDGDGKWDLLTGSDNGGVYCYRNVGGKGKPVFAEAIVLVPPHKGDGYDEFVDTDEAPSPGIRSQISVADYDGDGKLDLLVGDFRTTLGPRSDLTPEERQKLRELRGKLAATSEALTASAKRLNDELWKPFKDVSPKIVLTQEFQEKIRKRRAELVAAPEYKKLADEAKLLGEALRPLLARPAQQRFGNEDYSTPHGHVWLYRRR